MDEGKGWMEEWMDKKKDGWINGWRKKKEG